MALTEQQRKDRRLGVGGSDVAAILGCSRYSSALDIYNDKVGPLAEDEPNEAKDRGNKLEPIIISRYEQENNCQVEIFSEPFLHRDYPFLRANIDGRCGNELVECKSVHKWSKTAKLFGEDGTDNIPDEYLIQCAFYAEVVTNCNSVIIPTAFVSDNSGTAESIERFSIYRYERNEQLGQGVIQHAVRFWEDHVLKKIPPPGESLRAKANPITKSKIVTPELAAIYSEMRRMKEQVEILQKAMEGNKEKLIEYLDEFELLKDESGKELATWKDQTSNRFDMERFRVEHPELYALYIKTAQSRVFRLKGESHA